MLSVLAYLHCCIVIIVNVKHCYRTGKAGFSELPKNFLRFEFAGYVKTLVTLSAHCCFFKDFS